MVPLGGRSIGGSQCTSGAKLVAWAGEAFALCVV